MAGIRIARAWLVGSALAAGIAGARGPGSGPWDLGPARPDAGRAWTLAIYLAADNDLEAEALADLNELEGSLPETGIEAIVLLDRARGGDATDGDWTDARVLRVRPGEDPQAIESEVLARPGELDLGSPETLEAFLAAALRTFPARRHGLAIGGHGRGWQALAADLDAPGSPGGFDELALGELRAAIERAIRAAGIPKLDLIVLDASLMAQIEVAAEIQPFADALVASEGLLPPGGVPYATVLEALGRDLPGAATASAIVRACGRSFDEAGEIFATLSAIELARLPEAIAAVDLFARRLGEAAPSLWPRLSRAIFYAESYGERDDLDPSHDTASSVDLIDMARRMGLGGLPADDEASELIGAVERCVIERHRGRIRAASGGLAIHAPLRGRMLSPAYERTAFAARTRWLSFLRTLHDLQARDACAPAIRDVRILDARDAAGDLIAGRGGARIGFALEGTGILRATVRDLARIPGGGGFSVVSTFALRGPGAGRRWRWGDGAADRDRIPEFPDGRSEIEIEADRFALGLTDGRRTLEATFDASSLDDRIVARVPAVYADPDVGAVVADIVFTRFARATAIIANIPLAEGIVARRRIAPRPDAEIAAIREIISPDARWRLERTGTARWGEGLEVAPRVRGARAGAWLIEVETIAGRTAREIIPYEIEEAAGRGGLAFEGEGFGAKDLAGSWSIERGTIGPRKADAAFRASGEGVTFSFDPRAPSRLLCAWRRPDDEMPEAGSVLLVAEPIPILLFFRQEDGGLVRSGAYFGFAIREAARPCFILEDAVARGAIRLRPPAAPR